MSNDETRMTNSTPISARRQFMAAFIARHSSFIILPLLSSCSSIPFLAPPAKEAVVYALGSREGYTSPLNANLKPACPALEFGSEGFRLDASHEHALRKVISTLGDNKKPRLVIAGYAPPELPQDHARALSERRAQAVRQRLIELGLDSANLQTIGFGNDFSPSGPSSGVVVIYQQ